ncbi:MAG TPA: response regulator transcription factor [Puia sp.]
MIITLVIVEDLDEVREGLKNFLALSPGFKVLDVYKSGEDAATGIPLLQPDIVIMDINLPGMSGIDCVRITKKSNIRTQFMMFTVYENDEKVFEALKAGASGYLLKNTGLTHIVEALKELYEGGSPMSANIARKLVRNFQEQAESETLAKIKILSSRENETLHLLSQGLLYKEIADQLGISTSTVRQHIHRIYEKLHVQNRTEALNKAFKKN